ncbi:MAG: MFS transporter [Synechococcales cyanobacterium]
MGSANCNHLDFFWERRLNIAKVMAIWGLTDLSPQLWLLLLGRLMSQLGTGFTLFYAAIYFVNDIGLSATQVGLGLALFSLTGVVGRIAGGSLADGAWGRKGTLLTSLLTSALGSILLALSRDVSFFWVANAIAGLGQGLYWPSAEAMVADLATVEQRGVAFALNRLSDNVGLSVGVALGGVWVSLTNNYPALFMADGISFLVFAGLVLAFLTETQPQGLSGSLQRWRTVLQDRALLVFCAANLLLTTYLSQLSSTLPYYLQKFVGIPLPTISVLFTLHVVLACGLQLPMVSILRRYSYVQGLQATGLLWMLGFGLAWWTGRGGGVTLAVVTLAIMAVAMVVYNPCASALVVSLAPAELRGVYLSMNSLCWAAGYALGPALGGLALDQQEPTAGRLWLFWMMSTLLVLAILHGLTTPHHLQADTTGDNRG